MKRIASACTLVACLLMPVACKDREACERLRMDVANQWEAVKQAAARRALGTVDSGGSVETWTKIQDWAELVESSFQTKQVTWGPAEKAKKQIEAEFEPLGNDQTTDVKAFKTTLTEADKKYRAFESQCR